MKYIYRFVLIFLSALILVGCFAVSVSAAQPKLVALTFDDGPGPYTERLLNGLAEKNVRATFFCLGNRAEQYPELIQRMIAEGHQVANHSYSHPNLSELAPERAIDQISETDRILNRITGGQETYYIRPPYGNTTQTIRKELNAPVIIWSVDTIDWQLLNGTAVKNKILSDTFDGSIVLMHDIHWTTIDGILAALDTLKSRGYEFVTVKELLRRRGISAEAGQQYYRCDTAGADLQALKKPEIVVQGSSEQLEILLESSDGAPVYYTIDGSDITYTSQRYESAFTVSLPCTVRAVAAWDLNGDRSEELCLTYTLPPAGEPIVSADNGILAFEPAHEGETVFVKEDGWESYVPAENAELPRDTWFSYYADGEGLAASPVNKLLFTKEGNLASDLHQSDWYYSAMDYCISRGLFNGYGQWKYDPTGILTRAMLIELLYRFDEADHVQSELPFTDVSETAYYADALKWGYARGIVEGVGGGCFAPNRPVTRQELAKMLVTYLEIDADGASIDYRDQADISKWAVPYVQTVGTLGYMTGSGGYFRPLDSVSRAEAATIFMRMEMY